MTIESLSMCDECRCILREGVKVYCFGCYSKLEGGLAGCAERITELEDKITGLEYDLKMAISKLPD